MSCQFHKMKFQSLRGMNDIYPPEIYSWDKLLKRVSSVAQCYNFSETKTPLLEPTALFQRGVGEATDIVEKEMYTFEDRNGESLTLRPEGTASVVRSLVQHNILRENPIQKLFYIGPMYRHERPQKGRYREFYQFGFEYFGPQTAGAEAELMTLHWDIFKSLNLSDAIELHINSLGCSDCRKKYNEKLSKLLENKKKELPESFHSRIYKNPQRIFDQKDEASQKIAKDLPVLLHEICQSCKVHHEELKVTLSNINVPFIEDPYIVRGIDYYTRTTFEFITDKLGAQSTVCGGGRYDGLVEQLGGPKTAAAGCAAGVERLVLLCKQLEGEETAMGPDIFLIYPSEENFTQVQSLCHQWRSKGLRVDMCVEIQSMKKQMKQAHRCHARFCGIFGNEEASTNSLMLKDMSKGSQNKVELEKVIEYLR